MAGLKASKVQHASIGEGPHQLALGSGGQTYRIAGVVVVARVWLFHFFGMRLQLRLGADDELVAHFSSIHKLDADGFARGGLPVGGREAHVVAQGDRHGARDGLCASATAGVRILLRGSCTMCVTMAIARMPHQLRPRQGRTSRNNRDGEQGLGD